MSEAAIRKVIMPHRNYPRCVLEVVDDQMTYRPRSYSRCPPIRPEASLAWDG
jgi:hypothetical protein